LQAENTKLSEKNNELSVILKDTNTSLKDKLEEKVTELKSSIESESNNLHEELTALKNLNLDKKLSDLDEDFQNNKITNEEKLVDLNSAIDKISKNMQKLQGIESQISEDQMKELNENLHSQFDSKVDMKLDETKNELNLRIDGLEENFSSLAKNVDEKLRGMNNSPTQHIPTPKDSLKKRVKSAAKKRNINGKKLEEMRRWLEYQRRFTADEIKKKTDQFKEQQDSLHPKINQTFDLGG